MTYLIVDNDFTLNHVMNFPFAVGSFKPAYTDNAEARKAMLGSRIFLATPKDIELIRDIGFAGGRYNGHWNLAERARRCVEPSTVTIYIPKALHDSDNPEELTVPEVCIEFGHEDDTRPLTTFSIWEHPSLARVPGFLTAGRYYGYPECCIFAFIQRAYHEVPGSAAWERSAARSKGYQCIVCEDHAKRTVAEVTEEIMANRQCPEPFEYPEGETPPNLSTRTLQYLLAFATGKMATRYNLGDGT